MATMKPCPAIHPSQLSHKCPSAQQLDTRLSHLASHKCPSAQQLDTRLSSEWKQLLLGRSDTRRLSSVGIIHQGLSLKGCSTNTHLWRFSCGAASGCNEGSRLSSGSGNGGCGSGGHDGSGFGGGSDGKGDGDDGPKRYGGWGLFSSLAQGWRDRVCADPQFPFKIFTEEIIGVGASAFGDMACRPSFGLRELDFVFSNIVVCAIVNFVLMYMLAPTASAGVAASLPGLFSRCPPGHMFERGAYLLVQRAGTLVYKGAVFATVGFCAGLIGTALSTMLLDVRKKLDPSFSLQNASPPTLLNAATWALQLGVSSNSRYQLLNGLEFGLEGMMNPGLFKGLVFAIRSLNNVVGGMSFVMMARLTGSQGSQKRQEQAHHPLEVQSS